MRIDCDRVNDPIEKIFDGVYGYKKPYNCMKADLKDRVAVITGASGMIGGATADLYAKSGCHIAILDIADEAGEARAKRIREEDGVKAKYYHCNLGSREEISDTIQQVYADFGKIDILFCNAGGNWGNREPLPKFDDQKFEMNNELNLHNGTVWIIKQVIPQMIEQGSGNILLTSSVCGVTGLRRQCGFVGSKFAMAALTKSMALEYAKYGIRVNCLAPGSLPLPQAKLNFLWDTVTFEDYDANFEHPDSMVYDIAARRPAYPTDMAGLMLYLVSDDASYTTGQVICVDGGWTAGFSGDY